MTFTLRPYQQEFDDAMRAGHEEYDSILGELATGLGKTVSFTKYASSWEHGRTMVVCPQIPLISQAAKKILRETGIMPAIEQASLRSNEAMWARNPYIVASKQTLCGKSKRYRRFSDIGLLILDEAHYACTEIYAEMVHWFRDRGAKVLGVTATAKRHDNRAMGQVFDECVFQYGICDAISDAWLVPVKVTCLQLEELDLTDVDISYTPMGKDFNQRQLNDKVEDARVVHEICEAVNLETRGQKTAIYCASINQAQAVAELLVDNYGIRAEWICSDKKRCSDHRRQEALESFCNDPNGITHLANVGILTTGWDYPDLMCIVNARPTKSLPLYTQIMGRLTRPCEVDGRPVVDRDCASADDRKAAIAASRKPYGRMIDLVDNSLEHKLITATDVLGGKWELAVQEWVKKNLLNKTGPIDLDEEAQRAEAELQRLKEEEERRKALAAQRAKAKFRAQEVDPFGGRRAPGVQRSPYFEPATQKQMGFLRWKMGNEVYKYNISKRQAMRMIGQFKEGKTVDEVKRTNRLRSKTIHQPSVGDVVQQAFELFR